MNLARRLHRLSLIPRARRVAFEREMADIDAFLDAIRSAPPLLTPPTQE